MALASPPQHTSRAAGRVERLSARIVVFNSARLVRLGEELEPFQAVSAEPTGKGTGPEAESVPELAPRAA